MPLSQCLPQSLAAAGKELTLRLQCLERSSKAPGANPWLWGMERNLLGVGNHPEDRCIQGQIGTVRADARTASVRGPSLVGK